ncbi:hypothetical protein FC17_GL000639 [Secundilactobacillus paracollinoides DSM 15502 = JCM 11969]|nr:hypothetical protein FC17_GL000639 [Secundilactobacillus paracollinoides DSM 15502 = JCM 11969]
MAQFGTEPWCRHQLATVLGSVTDVRDDEDPLESRAAEIELASSRATTAECQIAECNGRIQLIYPSNPICENHPHQRQE